jgi:hypothetical protein
MNTVSKEKARLRLYENVNYELRDAEGNLKPLFHVNKLGRKVLEFVRRHVDAYDAEGNRKSGFLADLALYGLRIPGVTGHWTNSMTIANLITNAGAAGVASRINGSGAEAAFTYIAIGTGAVAAAVGDTTLGAEITTGGGARANSTASRVTTDVTNDTARLVNTFNFTASFAVTESGVLNAATVGTLLCRQVFSAINVANGDSLQITWDVDVD